MFGLLGVSRNEVGAKLILTLFFSRGNVLVGIGKCAFTMSATANFARVTHKMQDLIAML